MDTDTLEARKESQNAGTSADSTLESRPGPEVREGAAPPAARERRRSYWVNRQHQLPIVMLVGGMALFFVTFYNASMYIIVQSSSQAAVELAPETHAILRTTNRVLVGVTLIMSTIFVVGVSMISIRISHRTAGPVVNLRRHLGYLAQGDLGHDVKLRDKDNLTELADSVNELTRALRRRAGEDAAALETVAAKLEALDCGASANELVEEVRRMASDKTTAGASSST